METSELKNLCREMLDLAQNCEDQSLDALIAQAPLASQNRLRAEFTGYGPLAPLLELTDWSEIIIDGHKSMWIERHGKLKIHSDCFLSEVTLNNFIHRLEQEAKIFADLNEPATDGTWGKFRVHLVRPPLSERVQLCIRATRNRIFTLDQLNDLKWVSGGQLKILRQWLAERKNILIVGPTSSGKTTLLNALLQEFEANERVICLEDVSELHPKEGSSVKLLTRFDLKGCLREFALADLIRHALRMRPSRLVLGEVRGAEAKDLLLALATGHRGSLCTLHASDPQQALLRLEMLIQLGAQWDRDAIRKLIQLSIDGIVVVNFRDGQRSLEGLYRIGSLESFGFLIERLGDN